MKDVTRRIRIPAVLLLATLMVACSDKALQTAALAIEKAAQANRELASTVISENAAGVIPDEDTALILRACSMMATANDKAVAVTMNYTQFPAGQRPSLAALMRPVLDAVDQAMQAGLLGIKNPSTKQKVEDSLALIRLTLVSAQAAIGGN